MKKTLFLLFLVLIVFSCGGKKNAQNLTDAKITKDFYVVSFFSKGEGVNSDAVKILEDYLEKYKPKFSFSKQKWGREGEVNYCFDLSKTRKKKIKSFENKMLVLLEGQDLVNFSFDNKCK
jgi:hypothetical protein